MERKEEVSEKEEEEVAMEKSKNVKDIDSET